MIIIRVMGGLGNQLQQYALYKKFESLGAEVRLDVSWFTDAGVQERAFAGRELELRYFDGLEMKIASPDEVKSVLGRRYEEPESLAEKIKRKLRPAGSAVFIESQMYHPEIFKWRQKYLTGYWACERYYADILAQIRGQIRFPVSSDKRNQETAALVQKTESVSLHVRRGDYLDPENIKVFGNICTDAYYEKAVSYVLERFPKAVFYIFSDDADYVREKYKGDRYRIVDWNQGKDSFYDMMLMSLCRHNICANSTFSFWGARLNPGRDKLMIRPSIHRNNQICEPEKMKNLWTGWTLISPQGILI